MLKLCPLQELCREYTTGDNKPPNHDVRNKYPCAKWLSMECRAIGILYELIKGQAPACEITKVRRK